MPKVVDPLQVAQDDASKQTPSKPSPSTSDATSTSDPLDNSSPADDADGAESSAKAEMLTRNTIALEAQVEDRPLAKQQELLEEEEDSADPAVEPSDAPAQNGASESVVDDAHKARHHHKKALLKNDDAELQRIGMVSSFLQPLSYQSYILIASRRGPPTLLLRVR